MPIVRGKPGVPTGVQLASVAHRASPQSPQATALLRAGPPQAACPTVFGRGSGWTRCGPGGRGPVGYSTPCPGGATSTTPMGVQHRGERVSQQAAWGEEQGGFCGGAFQLLSPGLVRSATLRRCRTLPAVDQRSGLSGAVPTEVSRFSPNVVHSGRWYPVPGAEGPRVRARGVSLWPSACWSFWHLWQ